MDYTQDIIDVESLTDRFEELETELTEAKDGRSEQEAGQDLEAWCTAVQGEDEFPLIEAVREYMDLRALLMDLEGNGGDHQWRGDWYPATLIRDSYFRDYAQELAEDIGAINRDASWPNNCIDWDRATRELQMDYSDVEIYGVTYWYR